jgi:hypothetical protein
VVPRRVHWLLRIHPVIYLVVVAFLEWVFIIWRILRYYRVIIEVIRFLVHKATHPQVCPVCECDYGPYWDNH